MNDENSEKIEPIYEKISPGEILIISKQGNYLIYAANVKGELVLKKVSFDDNV